MPIFRSRGTKKNLSTPSFPPDEDVLQQLLGDEAVGPGRALRGPSVQSAVDGVQFRAQLASHVEPPIAHEHRLAELRSVRAQERCLASVYVAIMPRLASRLHVREEAWIGLVVAVEIRVGHLAQHGIIGACSTWYRFTKIQILPHRWTEESWRNDRCLVRRIVSFVHVLVIIVLVVAIAAVVLGIRVYWPRPLRHFTTSGISYTLF